jgi:hypothetical protein
MSIAKIKGSALPARNTAENTDYVLVISGGVTYKMLRSVFLAGITVSQDLQGALDNGKTAEFTDINDDVISINLGEYREDQLQSIISLSMTRDLLDTFQRVYFYLAQGQISLSSNYDDLINNIFNYSAISVGNGDVSLYKQNSFESRSKNQSFSFENETEEPSENLDILYKPNPKNSSGTYYLATTEDIPENIFISKQNGTFGSHTGDLLETVLSSDDVVGGFFVAGDTMLILISGEKSGAVANVTYRIRFGTTGTTSDELIATYTGNNRGLNMQRVNISFLSGNLVRVITPTTSLISDVLGTSAVFSNVSLTYSSAFKITITAQLGNATETASIRTLRASKIKSIT